MFLKKNHAIDEFLVDLVNALPRHVLRNNLIRIGGQCKDPRLSQFSEQNAYQSNADVKAKRRVVDLLDNVKQSIGVTMEGKAASFLSFRHEMFSVADDPSEKGVQKRRQAAVDATAILMESIGRWDLLRQALEEGPTEGSISPVETAKHFSFLELNSKGDANQTLKTHVNNSRGDKFVPGLDSEAAHYGYPHWGDLLFNWICGKKLLPKCQHEGGCDLLSVAPEPALCDNHRCRFLTPDQARCNSRRTMASQPYCLDHSCGVDDCSSARVSRFQRFCATHACMKCLSLGLKAKLAMDDPPRNVCEDHPLCVAPACVEFSANGEAYCTDHLRPAACSALNKRGLPCKGTAIARHCLFCRDHLHLSRSAALGNVGDLEVLDETDEDGQLPTTTAIAVNCLATTRKGKPCKGSVLPGSRYCYDHAPPEAILCQPVDQNPPATTNHTENGEEGVEENSDNEDFESAKSSESVALTSSSSSVDGDTGGITDVPAADPDEYELDEDEAVNLQHLREVFEVENVPLDTENCDEEDDGEASESGNDLVTPSDVESNHKSPADWSWDMSLEERWGACYSLILQLHQKLKLAHGQAKLALNQARKDLKKQEIKAKARVYENKSVIGGTMVGCIHRLEAIKTTRPFAVVVEEASEVLEPLLFSCLSESTVKLEMIGDHRQLQPSVQSRYDFEICNKVNISMFQRLIEAPSGHEVPSTVLSVQRRMRRNICDLTRQFYRDITNIEDHENVDSQKIGQRNASVSRLVASSSTAGREVPGVAPHVYLWTHGGEQKKSHVGVSRINPVEAEMCCSLVAYLVGCGVPRSSIAVLTPYKGQLMLIRKMLVSESRYSTQRLLSKQPGTSDQCRVSTVDRFQGDEEDIVICSLVVDEKSKTGFVKLVNRMIVLLSRARLGLYILGNVGYFEKGTMPDHWAETFKLLQMPTANDSDDSEDDSGGVSSEAAGRPRTGSALCKFVGTIKEAINNLVFFSSFFHLQVLCCPIHRNSQHAAKSATDLSLGFCKEICQHNLKCGHLCALACHWPQTIHNKHCKVQIDSPCERHSGKISCNHLFSNSPSAQDLSSALVAYRCPQQIELTLPCTHIVQLPCWEDQKIAHGDEPMPMCKKQSPTPYTFPACEHTLPVSCFNLDEYTKNPSLVRCDEDEEYHPDCGHVKKMKCWKRVELESGTSSFECHKLQQIVLPRCGHEHSVPCNRAQALNAWTGASVAEVGKVVEGVSYGPKDSICQKQVVLVRKCGHELRQPCNAAFAKIDKLGPCRELMMARHPICGHPCKIQCRFMPGIDERNAPPEISEVHEHDTSRSDSLPPGVVVPKCLSTVKLVRKCGHVESAECWSK